MGVVHKSSHGFTLIELVVVMVLLSVMTSFAMPAIRTSLYSDALKATARKLIGLVNETGQAARSGQLEYYLSFNSESQEFTSRAAQNKDDDLQSLAAVSVPDGVRVIDFTSVHGGEQTNDLRLRFSKKGYVDKTLIHLSDDDGRDMTLVLSPFLGVSRMYDSYRTLEDDKLEW